MTTTSIVVPTVDDLAKEGWLAIAGRPMSSTELERAVRKWFEDLMADLWQFATHQDITRLKSLENSATLVLTKGQRRYDWPEDFHRPIALTLLQAALTGAVTTDADDGDLTLTVANADDLLDYFDVTDGPSYALSGKYLVVTSGQGIAQMREIVSVDEAGGDWVLTIDQPWVADFLPAEDDTFMVATERGTWVDEDMRETMDQYSSRTSLGLPFIFNDFDKTLEFDAPLDKDYVGLLRYWSNPLKLDRTSPLMQKILTNWRAMWTAGFEFKTAKAIDDNRQGALEKTFETKKLQVIEQEYDHGPPFSGFRPAR